MGRLAQKCRFYSHQFPWRLERHFSTHSVLRTVHPVRAARGGTPFPALARTWSTLAKRSPKADCQAEGQPKLSRCRYAHAGFTWPVPLPTQVGSAYQAAEAVTLVPGSHFAREAILELVEEPKKRRD
jgi:hypothetical protein